MTKKHWIYVKRGLSEDPKHRQAMGDAVWLFMHIIDAADWEKGIVYDWRDAEIANDMSMSPRTVREWRQRLQDKGYIQCKQRQHSLDIIIHNWTDPRSYGGKKLNIKPNQGDIDVSPSKTDEIQGDTQGDTQGDMQGIQDPIVTPAPFIESISISTSISKEHDREIPGIVSSILQDRPTTQEDIDSHRRGWVGRESMPEPIRELLDVYVELTGQKPTKGKLTDWLCSAQEWLELGITGGDLRKAYDKANPPKGNGFAVVRPGSLTATAGAIAGERRKVKSTSTVDPMANFYDYIERKENADKIG